MTISEYFKELLMKMSLLLITFFVSSVTFFGTMACADTNEYFQIQCVTFTKDLNRDNGFFTLELHKTKGIGNIQLVKNVPILANVKKDSTIALVDYKKDKEKYFPYGFSSQHTFVVNGSFAYLTIRSQFNFGSDVSDLRTERPGLIEKLLMKDSHIVQAIEKEKEDGRVGHIESYIDGQANLENIIRIQCLLRNQ
jgi:hypothetical protein